MKKSFIVKCMNEQCSNYKSELNEGTEVCGLCNEKTVTFESSVNPKLKTAAICAGLISIVLFMWAWDIVWYASFAIAPASVILGLISRSRAAVTATSLSLLAFAGLFVYNFFIF